MTPQERALVTELFDRLATLETTRRDPDAERLIADGLSRSPNAVYALVQTVLLQDEAINRADARIRELEGSPPPASGSFLDSARNNDRGRGSVPSVSSGSKWNTGRSDMAASPSAAPAAPLPNYAGGGFGGGFGGGSFLGTAAAAAVGVIGGNMLFNGLRNMIGGAQAQPFGGVSDNSADRASPWGNNDASGSDLARDAGVNDVSGGGSRFADVGSGSSQGSDDTSGYDQQSYDDQNDDFFSDSDGDFGDGSSDA